MAILSVTLPTPGDPRSTEDLDVLNTLTALVNEFNGNIDASNLKADAVGSSELQNGIALELAVTTQQRKVAFGAATANGGGTSTGQNVITHGLGGTPVCVLATSRHSALFTTVTNVGGTQLTVVMRHFTDSPWSTSETFYWLAIA